MLKHVNKLHSIANNDSRNIIGLMSGTSLDGLDIAYCKIIGSGSKTKVELIHFLTQPYVPAFREEIRKIFSIKEGDIELLVLLHSFIGKYHGELINDAIAQWGLKHEDIDCIASHGQTIYHAPKFLHNREGYDNATLQIGDGDHLAVTTNHIVISDFRMKHIAGGGEGAPLAVYGDYLIFCDEVENRIMLNVGGIANFTWLPSEVNKNPYPSFSTDIGPGNTIMDAFIQKNYNNLAFDVNGEIARRGQVDDNLLEFLMEDMFFKREVPKTIGPELFNLNYLESALTKLKQRPCNDDIVATLNRFSAQVIVNAIINYTPTQMPITIYASGGGYHNTALMDFISSSLPTIVVKPTSDLGIHPDAKEAVLFALLANECIAGDGLGMSKTINGMPDISMGKICFPQ